MQSAMQSGEPGLGIAGRFIDDFPTVVIVNPIFAYGKSNSHLFVAFHPQTYVAANLDLGRLKEKYQLWCMQTDGLIAYDSNGKSQNLNIFQDSFFDQFPDQMLCCA